LALANQLRVALATWRESERRLERSTPDERARRAQEVVRARAEYLRLVADQAASVADQATSDRDQAASDRDRRRADSDQLESDRDQQQADEVFAALTAPTTDQHAAYTGGRLRRLQTTNERHDAQLARTADSVERARQSGKRDRTEEERARYLNPSDD
jgi:hypothetical protein